MHFMGWTGLSGNPGSRLIANTLFRGSAWCFSGFTMTRSSDPVRHFHRTDLIAGDTDRAKRSTRHWTTKPRASTSIRKLRAKSGQSSLLYGVLKWDFNALHLHYRRTLHNSLFIRNLNTQSFKAGESSMWSQDE